MLGSSALFRMLGDDARLRVLRLLDGERLNVSELTGILGIAQSGVSRHLGLLKEAGLVEEDRDGGFSYYRIAAAVRDGANGFGPVWPLLQAQFEAAAATAGRARQTMPGWRRCAGCARRTSMRTRGRIRTSGSSCPGGAGRRGPARSGTCCRRCASPISGAARAT